MFIFLDTETTGTGPEDRLCQIAFKPEGGPAVCETFNPGMPISNENIFSFNQILDPHTPSRRNFMAKRIEFDAKRLLKSDKTIFTP
jgi:hypothetical protein